MQLKLSHLNINAASNVIADSLAGYLMVESCQIEALNVTNGLVNEMYASGIIFDCIIVVQAN